jgi:hypothetical protein
MRRRVDPALRQSALSFTDLWLQSCRVDMPVVYPGAITQINGND